MRITFVVRLPAEWPARLDLFRVLLRALHETNVAYLRANPSTVSLYNSTIVYRPEPIYPDCEFNGCKLVSREDWQDVWETIERGEGDCEDLACWRSAELEVRRGIKAVPEPVLQPGQIAGMPVIHIVVKYPDGRTEDPSAILIDKEKRGGIPTPGPAMLAGVKTH